MNGQILNIQKFSIHDGPGIRTVVFFKGCPLRCAWCSNPESQLQKTQILWDEHTCAHCLTCVEVCPRNAIQHLNERIVIDFNACDGCMKCVDICSKSALRAEGKDMSVQEIVRIVLQDRDFYDESGGGVTLSGGEVLAQIDFAIDLIKALKEHNIHIAIETTGYAHPDQFKRILPYVDLFLFDVKHTDSTKHRNDTHVDNIWIKINLKLAIEAQKKIIARIPIIPDFNDTVEDAKAFVAYFKEIGIHEVNLLPYHNFGELKYKQLNRVYRLSSVKNYHPEDLSDYLEVFTDAQVKASF